ncbi:Mitochondrial arginine transporter BAC2 [Hibiscus syriacus]|uniref:Mitochondrial arginine transporter BAC2 n=1 Tax=Hibiscus syriacus TaxID=106335 RepID=A0A6A3A0F3_HIBSY|nr:Mitochondrial arginine transporter BAC2 [Hibiscus syriacus]
MDFWPEILRSSWGKEFVAGGFGGMACIVSGYPLDTLRIRLQNMDSGSAPSILGRVVSWEGPGALYRGMAAPLASVTFQNRSTLLQRCCTRRLGTGALQSIMLSPVELVKIRLQLQNTSSHTGPMSVAKTILKTEGLRGLYRGFTISALRDAPAHGFYFWTYEYVREQLHPGCRKSGEETLRTMVMAGGLAGVASWVCCYPLDVVKTRLQAQSPATAHKYKGIIDCLQKSVKQEGYSVLWRGLGTAVARAFVVNGAIFSAYEIALRCFFNNGNIQDRSHTVA